MTDVKLLLVGVVVVVSSQRIAGGSASVEQVFFARGKMSSGRGGSWTFAGAVVVALLLLDFVDFAQTKVKHTRSPKPD